MAGRRGRASRGTSRTRRGRGRRVPAALALAALLACAACALATLAPSLLGPAAFYPVRHAEAVEAAAERHGVDPLLACAVIKCESGWDEAAVSSAGAVGLMQVMPQTAESISEMGLVTAESFDPRDVADPLVNVEYGCAYLGYLQRQLSSFDEVVAAYNAGIGTVQRWLAAGARLPEGIEYEETRAYLERVRDAYEGYRSCYPEGITAA